MKILKSNLFWHFISFSSCLTLFYLNYDEYDINYVCNHFPKVIFCAFILSFIFGTFLLCIDDIFDFLILKFKSKKVK